MNAAPPAGKTSVGATGLIQDGRAAVLVVVCLGVWLNAVDALVSATIMPSVARDIGGYAYFAWATAGFMLGSILAGACAGQLAETIGLRRSLATCGLIYAVGCGLSAVAVSIGPFLIGRLVQGVGAGFVIGLCYVVVRTAFPERFWSTVFASLSAVWGVATLLGPLLGGCLADLHLWRAIFWLFAAQAVAFAVAVRVLPRGEGPRRRASTKLPLIQLGLLGGAVCLIAAAAIVGSPPLAAAMVLGGLTLLGAMLRLDRTVAVHLLPRRASDLSSRAGLGYATVFCLSASAIAFSVYGAAILQARLGLSPLVAGYVVASESLGWTVTALLAPHAPIRFRGGLVRVGAATVAAGLLACALTLSRSGIVPITASGLAMGAGFGLCWSFVAQRILNGLPPDDAATGAGAIPMTQILGNAVGAAAAGVLANVLRLARGFDARIAGHVSPILVGAFVPVALLGAAAAWELGRAVMGRPHRTEAPNRPKAWPVRTPATLQLRSSWRW